MPETPIALTRDEVHTEWKAIYEKALANCPVEFQQEFAQVLFAAQRAMNAISIVATAEAFKAASEIVLKIKS